MFKTGFDGKTTGSCDNNLNICNTVKLSLTDSNQTESEALAAASR